MAGLYDGLDEAPGIPLPAPKEPNAPASLYEGLEIAPNVAPPREASGVLESLQAGFQASAPGLAWRGKLPDLVINPEHASWWERALSGVGQVGSELPLMVGGAIAGAPAGAAIGTAAGPLGTAAGTVLGAGFGMGAVPAAIRESLIQAYKSGEVKTAADYWNILRDVVGTAAKEGAINAVGMGAGGVAARTLGKAIAPAIGQTMTVGAGTAAIAGADVAAQIATMATMPAALQGRLPDLQEITDAAILVGGLHLAGVTASRITSTYLRTGKTPAEQVADAQRDPEIARELTTPPPAPEPEPVWTANRETMLKVQENLFTETARLNEMQARADATPLSDAERVEFNGLKSKVLDLERQLTTGAPELARTPTYTADQFVEARRLADERVMELEDKVASSGRPLSDAERAERVFLRNSLDRPDALARHFDLEPQRVLRPSPEQLDASAQKIHDDVLRQIREADEARQAAGKEPLGDEHAQAVAALVRARMRTRAARLGVLPETLYNERPVKIADEGGPEAKPGTIDTTPTEEAAAALLAPEAPAVDLFGDPVQPEAPAERMQVENLATQEVPLANLVLSKEVPQFKNAANREGVVVPLGGRFDRTGVGPIQVWERLDGTLEVISGRHRLDLAKRSGEESIPAQIHREADGFTARQAATLDAQLNIREEQGSVADYAQYFKDAEIDKAAADELGLLARSKGRAGFAIARDASPDLLASHRAGNLSDEAALAISAAAPGSARLQALGISAVQDGKSILFATNLMRSVDMMAAERMAAGEQGDIFGFDDSALREASAMAKKASAKQRAISEQIAAVSGASKRPELARKMGVNVEDPAAIQAKIVELRNEQYLWDNWPLYPELVAKLRGETLKQDPVEFPLPPETPAESEARDRDAADAAQRRADDITPAVLYQSQRDTWYRTVLGEAVDKLNMKAAPVQGWLDALKGLANKGVKADEIKWSGIEEWLQLQEGRVTKEQVADYLANNGVKVEEVMLGAETPTPPFVDGWDVYDTRDGRALATHPTMEAARQDAEARGAQFDYEQRTPGWVSVDSTPANATKFGTYQLPGGQNYRELKLLLPGGAFESSHFPEHKGLLAHIRFNERTDADGKKVLFIEEFQSDWAQKGKKEGFTPTPEERAAMDARIEELAALGSERATDADRQEWRDLMNKMAQPIPQAPFVGKTDAWVGLAMKRMISYAAQNGFERVAWTRGEQQVERYTSALRKAVDVIEWTKTDKGVQLVGYKGRPASPKWEKVDEFQGEPVYATADRQYHVSHNAGFPWRWNGPRGTSDGGFDTAEQAMQAAKDNAMPGGQKVVDTTEKEDALSDAIGKAMADKIISDPNQSGTIEGDGIRIDSTGMAGFYDKIVPKVANEVLKKLGGGKVDETNIAVPGSADRAKVRPVEADHEPDFIEMDSSLRAAFGGLEDFPGDEKSPLYSEVRMQVGDSPDVNIDALVMIDPNGVHVQGVDADGNPTFELLMDLPRNKNHDRASVQAWVELAWSSPGFWNAMELISGHLPAKGASDSKQMSFDITPKMKDEATNGLPLFQGQSEHRGSYDIAENLVTIMKGADKSTVVHELGHSWLEEMKADAARDGAPDQVRADWDIIRRELAIGEDGEISRASHEQFARGVERYLADGEAPSVELRSVFERFKTWLLDIYRDLRNLNVEINPELRAVMDRMLATDDEIKAARALNVPRAYVPEALAAKAETIVPPPAERRKIEPGFKAEQASMQPYADELPPGPGEAPDNIHVNYAYINSADDVKLAMQRMAEIDQANIQRQRGGTEGVKSWAEANAEQARYLNDILGGNDDTLHLFEPRDPDAPHVDVRLGILKKLAVGAAKDSARLRDVVLEKGHDATVREQLEYMGSIERARMIQAEFLGERASVARALNALKDTTEGTGEIGRMLEAIGLGDVEGGQLFQAARSPAEEQAYLKAKLDEILQNYKGKSVLDIAKLHKEIGTLKGSFKFAEDVTKATKWEMIIEGWRAGLLSGPVTHTTNLFGTEAFHVMRAPVDMLASMIGMARGASPGMGESDRASMSEAVARLTGMLGAVGDGVKIAVATYRLDDPTGKTEAYRTAIPGRAGNVIRIPLRLMGAEDALVSTMYTRGELRTLAIRQAFDEDRNPGTREFADRVQQLINHPTEDMQVKAEAAATRMTFNAPLGEKGVALQLFVAKWNLQWMIPFIRTPINIAKELARMSPFAPIVGEWREAIAKGGVERDRALAEAAVGSGIMALTAAYAFAGNVSGGGSPDPGKNRGKAGVWQPYSILIGDKWYEYSRIAPTGTLMGLAADMAAVWDHMNDDEKDKVPKMLAAAFAQSVTNQTFLQGITNVLNAMSDPSRFAPRFFQQLAGSMVPNVIGQPTTMADPVVREVNSALEAIQARIPGMRQNLLPQRDWLGEETPTRQRAGVILPSGTLEITKDKVRLEAARLDLSMAASPKKTHIGKGTGKIGDVELTPEERDTFEKVGGEMAHQILGNIVNSPGYDQIPDLVKRTIFAKVLTASHRVGAVAALPPDKRQAYLQTITEKMQQELQPGDQP